jgi:hypothetical protein
MKEDNVRRRITEELPRVEQQLRDASGIKRARLSFRAFIIGLDIRFVWLTPTVVCCAVFYPAYWILSRAIPSAPERWVMYGAVALGLAVALPRLFRNISLQEFAEQYLDCKKTEGKR